jgi:predicted polyphosphate/ATP-dependent NAD kinase
VPVARIGLIVNPIAGMGGRVGLKGTDGPEILRRAIELGAEPVAPGRARATIETTRQLAAESGLQVDIQEVKPRSADETRAAATAFRDDGVDLLLFVGGDGTARDVCAAIGLTVPVLGVPAGVKMHSAVFATGPRSAAGAAVSWLRGPARRTREREVVDIDEAALRDGRMSVRLYGTLLVPDDPARVQALKVSGARPEAAELAGLAAEFVGRLTPGTLVLLGPGTTTRAIGQSLAVESTLLGVDVVEIAIDGTAVVVVADATESAILRAIRDRPAVIVVSPTGGQGFVLGRGNQQLSPAVIRTVGLDRLILVATSGKLAELGGRPLLVDTGDPDLDGALSGYARVITGRGTESVCRVAAG